MASSAAESRRLRPAEALASSRVQFPFATVQALIYLVLTAALGLQISHANWGGVAVVLIAALRP